MRKLSIRFHVINVVAIHVDGTIPGGASLHSDTIAEAAKVLQTMYGTSKSVATAVDVVVPVWEHAPHFLGSYSNIAVGTDGTDFVNMEKNMGGVWLSHGLGLERLCHGCVLFRRPGGQMCSGLKESREISAVSTKLRSSDYLLLLFTSHERNRKR